MRILLVCMQHDYGDQTRGYSYEYYNFYLSLKDVGHEVVIYDYMEELREHGRQLMNKNLRATVLKYKPQLALFSLYTDQLDPDLVRDLQSYTTTLCFFHDDTWRVEYSVFWARQFTYFMTPDSYGEQRYAKLGFKNAIHFPFGCNEGIYQKLDCPKVYDVSFVGGWHPYREWLIHRLRKAGIAVEVAGYRWPNGILPHERMVRLFNESRINLNITNSASWDIRYLLSSPSAVINRVRSMKTVEQLKARHFEINGCGGFQLSYYVGGLEHYYDIGKELCIYTDSDDLVEKVMMYLEDAELREAVARAGYQRTMQEHTFAHRFEAVFKRIGIQ